MRRVEIDRLVDGLIQDLVDRVWALEGGRIRTSGWRSLVESFAREIQREALKDATNVCEIYAHQYLREADEEAEGARNCAARIRALMPPAEGK